MLQKGLKEEFIIKYLLECRNIIKYLVGYLGKQLFAPHIQKSCEKGNILLLALYPLVNWRLKLNAIMKEIIYKLTIRAILLSIKKIQKMSEDSQDDLENMALQ